MARQARIVVPGHPHHQVNRGNLRAQVFSSDDARRSFLIWNMDNMAWHTSVLAAARKKMTFVYDYMSRRVLKYTHDWDTSSNAWSAGFMHKYG